MGESQRGEEDISWILHGRPTRILLIPYLFGNQEVTEEEVILICIVGLCTVAILWVLLYLHSIRRTNRFMGNWEREMKEKAEKSTLESTQALEKVAKGIEGLPESIQLLGDAAEAIKTSRKAVEKCERLAHHMSLSYKVKYKRISRDDGGGWLAYIPQLGKFAFQGDGETKEEALKSLNFIKEELFKEYLRDGINIPEPEE